MRIDRYDPEEGFARGPELADQTDPVLVPLDRLLDDDQLYGQVRADLAQRYALDSRWSMGVTHSTPAEVLRRVLVVQHLYAWSSQEPVERVADSVVLRWCCRSYFRRVPDQATLLRWAHPSRPTPLQALLDRSAVVAKQAPLTRARTLRIESTWVQPPIPIPHPTASGRFGDGVRVLTRLLRRARPLVQVQDQVAGVRQAVRSRLRARRRLLQQ